ncbi:MAG: TetR/AcrR family transcriptional regulator [Deltaproteobacteria bacterium]|nr:MAG: TetR/AcrR family transcriptional regulator [Deltaproteobacteria bacterium]
MPRIVDSTAQRREIRGAARRVFARRGVAGTGLAHVAEAAGMGRSSLYHYYPDRASLVRDLVRDLLAEEKALFAAVAREPGRPLERIERLVALLAGVLEEWAALGPLLLDLWSRNARRFRPFFRSLRGELAGMIRAGQSSGEIDGTLDPQLAAASLIGAVDGILLQRLVDPDAFADTDAVRDTLVRAARKQLAP